MYSIVKNSWFFGNRHALRLRAHASRLTSEKPVYGDECAVICFLVAQFVPEETSGDFLVKAEFSEVTLGIAG
jgi:hypothetical protein